MDSAWSVYNFIVIFLQYDYPSSSLSSGILGFHQTGDSGVVSNDLELSSGNVFLEILNCPYNGKAFKVGCGI